MSSILEEIFVITHEGDYIPFFNRYYGDSGRDIAAVKIAIGTAYSRTLDGEPVTDTTIGTSWFECTTNQQISNEQLKKFDQKLRLDLMSFQLRHQFIMVSYYFEKYCVFEIENKQQLEEKVKAAINLFDVEFGSIGESTIAALHGWRPNSVPYNYSFVTDHGQIIDEVPKELYTLVQQNIIEAPQPNVVKEIFQFGDTGYIDTSKYFNDNSHSKKMFANRIGNINTEKPYYALYTPVSIGSEMTESQLFVSAKNIMISSVLKDSQELMASERYRALSPMLEPDHLSDPDPFPIGQRYIGFFDRTEFTLENLPNFSNPGDDYIRNIEDIALTKILAYYNKPILWKIDSDLTNADVLSFVNKEDADSFSSNRENFYVTTRTAMNTISDLTAGLPEGSITAIYKQDVQSINEHSPIRFIEFRTPSLRPGDVYRAYFEVSKHFLDKIQTGTFAKDIGPLSSMFNYQENRITLDRLSEMFKNEYCIVNAGTEEQIRTKREKYKAHAMKRKLELAREMRSKSLLSATTSNPGIEIDLGVFGAIPGPLTGLLDDTSLDFGDLTSTAFDQASNLAAAKFPTGSAPNPLVIHFSDFEEGIDALVAAFRSDQVKSDLAKQKPSSPLDPETEANHLSHMPGLIRKAILNSTEYRERVRTEERTKSLTPAQILDEPRMGWVQDNLTGTKIKIKFTEDHLPQIQDIFVENKKYFTTDIHAFSLKRVAEGNQDPLFAAGIRPRTLNYVKNIYNIIPGNPSDWVQALQQLVGIGSSPCSDNDTATSAGAALIMKYTIDSDGNIMSFTDVESPYKPIHNRFLDSEEAKRVSDAWDEASDWWDRVDFSRDFDIPRLGPTCSGKEIGEFVNKNNLAKLLCDFFSCIQLPNISVKLPKLTLPEIPRIPTFTLPGFNSRLLEIIEALFVQFLCSMLRNLLDVLSSPFCEEQIVRDLYGAASDVNPDIQLAFADAMVDLGIPKNKNQSASLMITDLVNFLTPREICALLQGNPVNRQVYNIIKNLASNYALTAELDSEEKIITFFQSLGVFVPDSVCSRLAMTDNLLGTQNCRDTADLLTEIRNAATKGNVDPARVNEAVAQAEKNIMDKTKAYQLFMGDFTLEDMYPDLVSTTTEDRPALQSLSKIVVDTALDIPKRSFISSMDRFVPSMFLDVSNLVKINDPEYDPVATMKFLRAINNIQKISNFNVSGQDMSSRNMTRALRLTLERLCDDFEKVQYKDFEVYRSQLAGLETPTLPDDMPEFNLDPDMDPYSSIKTSLKGSLMKGEDLSDEFLASGLLPLNGDGSSDPNFQANAALDPLYQNIWETMFPIVLEVPPSEDSPTSTSIVINSWYAYQSTTSINGTRNPDATPGSAESASNFSNISLNISYLKAINNIVQKYQNDIEQTMEKVFNVVSKEKLLEVIRDFYDIKLEAIREDPDTFGPLDLGDFEVQTDFNFGNYGGSNINPGFIGNQDPNLPSTASPELIEVKPIGDAVNIFLRHPNVGLMYTQMSDETMNEDFIKNTTHIDDPFFFGSQENSTATITLCEEVPEKFQDFFDEGDQNVSLRRKSFKNHLTTVVRELYDEYRTSAEPGFNELPQFENLPDLQNLEQAINDQYIYALEGITQQLVDLMSDSRILNDPAYLDRISSKIRSRSYINISGEDNPCIINPSSQVNSGPVKFDDLVTNSFSAYYLKELSDPENSIYTINYSKPGPFEKAMMTTALIGYIRIACLEALLKGCISYSSWDIDFVSNDKLFFEYMATLIERSIEKQPGFSDYRSLVDDAFRKITGTNNRKVAIRSILRNELSGYISKLSKILFENDVGTDYYNWFLQRIPLVNAPHLKALEDQDHQDQWVSNLKDSDIIRFRNNSFTFLERYIRTSSTFEGTLGDASGFAQRQSDALMDFIGYPADANGREYPNSFEDKLYNENNENFLRIPIGLHIPTAGAIEGYDIEDPASFELLSLSSIDPDAWKNKELWSLEDFQDLLRRMFSNNTGVEKFIFDLLGKEYDPSNLFWHGRPKTAVRKLPIKSIIRKRNYYRIEDKDLFSSKLEESFEPVVTHDNLPSQGRSQDAAAYHNFITNNNINDARIQAQGVPIKEYTIFQDRHYIISTRGKDLFEEDSENIQDFKLTHLKEPDGTRQTLPSRGIRLKYNGGSYWANIRLDSSDSTEDKIEGKPNDWVDQEIRGKTIFHNKAGLVDEEFYNKFRTEMGDSVEEEIWEEYIIDLVGQASPVFNQPGISEYNGKEARESLQNRLADAFESAAKYTRKLSDGTGIGTYVDRNAWLCKPWINQSDPKNFIISQNFGISCDYEGNETGDPAASWLTRGISFINKDQGFDLVNTPSDSPIGFGDFMPAAGYAFFENDIKLKYDGNSNAQGNYILDDKSKEVIGENEYKIPLRMLITQVKNGLNGSIKQCYVRYLIPENVTFSGTQTDSVKQQRHEDVYAAAIDAMNGYKNFIQGNFEWIADKIEDNRAQNDKEREILNAVRDWDKFYSNSYADGLNPGGLDTQANFANPASVGSYRALVINWLMGRRGADAEASLGTIPVLLRNAEIWSPQAGSHGAAFVSNEKIWSQAAQKEAKSKTGHFVVDGSFNEYTEFDEFFNYDIGTLLKKEQPTVTDFNAIKNIVSQMIPVVDGGTDTAHQSHYEDEIIKNITGEMLPKRYFAYARASKHYFYDHSVEDLLTNSNSHPDFIKSIGSLVSWFSQRRLDGFYGATSSDLKDDRFSKKGNIGFRGIQISAQSEAFKQEAADYDCGPSLFYDDKRILAESLMAHLRSILGEAPGGPILYKAALKNYRIQNAYKCFQTVSYDNSAGLLLDEGSQAAHVINFLNDEYKQRILKGKTLVTQNTDVVLSGISLNHALYEATNQEFSNVRGAYVHYNFSTLSTVLPATVNFNFRGFNINVANEYSIAKDPLFHNQGDDTRPSDRKFPNDGFIPLAPVTDSTLDGLSDEISKNFYINRVISDYEQILEKLTDRYESALRWADPLLRAIRDILFGGDISGAESYLESLGIKHGIRLNLSLKGLNSNVHNFIEKTWNIDSEVGEEERTGLVFYKADQAGSDENTLYKKMIVVPLASYERDLAGFDGCESDSFVRDIIPTILSRDTSMLKSLSEEERFKSFYEFSVPYRRIASLLTVHGTSMMAGYNTMPSVLTSTKSSLANLFKIMSENSNFGEDYSAQFGTDLSSISLVSAMGQDFPAGGAPPNCFAISGLNGDWFKMIQEMIEQFIIYFPSVILRGIADQLDPAYREMKSHYYACEIPNLKMNALTLSAGGGDDKTEFGLRGTQQGQKRYAPVNTAFPYDSAKGVIKMLTGDGGAYLGRSINRLITYITDGPKQLLDSSYAFQIPCMEDINGNFRNWEKFLSTGQYGRYGHPLSFFTLLALPTKELPRDKEYKREVCIRQELQRQAQGAQINVCSDSDNEE